MPSTYMILVDNHEPDFFYWCGGTESKASRRALLEYMRRYYSSEKINKADIFHYTRIDKPFDNLEEL